MEHSDDIITREERFTIDRVTHLKIGDPDYFDAIEQKRTTGGEKDLVYNKPVHSYKCEMDILEVQHELKLNDKVLPFKTIEVSVYCAGLCMPELKEKERKSFMQQLDNGSMDTRQIDDIADKHIQTMRGGKYYKADGKPVYHQLGCDCAAFEMTVNKKNYDMMQTGSDGYYGTVTDYRSDAGIRLSLSFDEDILTFDEIKKQMNYFFHINEKTYEYNLEEKENDEIERE